MKVNAVAGAVVDPEFADPLPDRLNIAGMAIGEPIETGEAIAARARSSRKRAHHLRKVSVCLSSNMTFCSLKTTASQAIGARQRVACRVHAVLFSLAVRLRAPINAITIGPTELARPGLLRQVADVTPGAGDRPRVSLPMCSGRMIEYEGKRDEDGRRGLDNAWPGEHGHDCRLAGNDENAVSIISKGCVGT